IYDRCLELYDMQAVGPDGKRVDGMEIDARLDHEAKTITAVGSAAALNRLAEILRSVESTVVQRETRPIRTAHARPSELAQTIRDLGARHSVLGGERGLMELQPFDDLDLLLITATNEQHQALAPLIASLDVPQDRSVPPL